MMRLPRTGRRGFTLIELLVVIAIIAILVGLLLPAVQKVREAAARMSCSNNLHNIAIAVHSYSDQNGHFPTNGPQFNFGPGADSWSWLTRILPNLEQGNLYNSLGPIDGGQTFTMAAALPGNPIAQPIKTFQCPADITTNGLPRTDCADMPGNMAFGQTNYKGVCGSNWAWGTYASTAEPDVKNSNSQNGLDQGDGIFYRTDGAQGRGPLNLALITGADGTSNTLMVGEDIPSLNAWCAWPYSNAATGTCAIPLNNALLPGQPGYGNKGDWPDIYSFRSRHTQGANFAMADGSVRFINQSISYTLYQNLATWNGGEVASPP